MKLDWSIFYFSVEDTKLNLWNNVTVSPKRLCPVKKKTTRILKRYYPGNPLNGIPFATSKIHNFFIWLFHINPISYFFSLVSNIATFFKIPIYIVSIFFLIFIFLFITSLFRFLFKFLFKNHSLKLFTSDNPKTIIQEVVSNQNTYLMDIEKKNEDLIKENNFLKEEKKIYKLITKDLEALNRINNKLSINTKTYDDLLKQTDTKKH
jgi:hypothetical protein